MAVSSPFKIGKFRVEKRFRARISQTMIQLVVELTDSDTRCTLANGLKIFVAVR